jgi:DNA recombination protein RmuC
MGKVGSSLESSITAFNAAVGSLERSVLPGARKFVELGVRTDKPIEELPQVEVTARVTEGAARRLTPPEEH